jgi:hypothetical protein
MLLSCIGVDASYFCVMIEKHLEQPSCAIACGNTILEECVRVLQDATTDECCSAFRLH